MTGMQVLTQIIQILVGGITGIATGIGSGLQSLVTSIFLTGAGTESDPTTLSMFGILTAVFAGIGLAIGLCRSIVKWIGSLGGRKV